MSQPSPESPPAAGDRSPLPPAEARASALRSGAELAKGQREARRGIEKRWILGALLWVPIVLAAALAAEGGELPGVNPWALLLLGLMVLIWLISRRASASAQRRRAEHRIRWYEESLARLEADRHVFGQADGSEYANPKHPYTDDLDVFGPGGLFERVNTTRTPIGRDALASLLTGTGRTDLGFQRSEATALVQELASATDLRAKVAEALGETEVLGAVGHERRLEAAERLRAIRDGQADGGQPVASKPWAVGIGAAFGFLSLATLVLWLISDLVGLRDDGGSMLWWTLGGIWAAGLIVSFTLRDWEDMTVRGEALGRTLDAMSGLIETFESWEAKSPLGKRLRGALASPAGRPAASLVLGQLDRSARQLADRRNVVGAFTYNLISGRDLKAYGILSEWLGPGSEQLGEWMRAAAWLEAFTSLADTAAGDPEPVFAEEPEAGAKGLVAEAVAHPLLPRAVARPNDVELSRQGAVLLITGSNMSGKSTLLRSLGLNVICSGVGLPVRAKRWRAPDFGIVTCMRVHDDLQAGSSRFHAEVDRLAFCLQEAASERPTLVLLDEILSGTNSKERHLGTRAVLEALLKSSGVSLLATHDLELAALSERDPTRVSLAHFRDLVDDAGHMSFDYLMREGTAVTTNALRVMRAAGLPVDEASD